MMRWVLLALLLGIGGAHAQAPQVVAAPCYQGAACTIVGGNVTAQVPTNAALKALTTGAYSVVYRAGYSAAGDGGAAVYNWSGTACSLNSGAGDNGSQVAPNSGTGCWLLDYSRGPITPMIWGAAGNGTTNDAAAMQAAVTAMQNRTLYLGSHLYGLSAGVTSSGQIKIVGDGGGEGIYATGCHSGFVPLTANITVLTLNGAGSSVSGTCVNGGGVTNTSGAGIAVGAANSVTIAGNQVNGECFGVDVSGSGTTQNVGALVDGNTFTTVNSASCAAIRVGANSTGGNTVNTKITNNEIYCNNASIGMLFLDSGGALVSKSTPYACSYGTKIFPGANQDAIWLAFDETVVGDTSTADDLLIDTAASSATITGLKFSASWSSAASGGPSVLIQDSASSGGVLGIHFSGHRTYMSGNNAGFDIKAGQDVTIDTSTICSGATSTGTAVVVEGSASFTAVRDNHIGMCDHPVSGTLATGISVTTSSQLAGNYQGNTFQNVTTPITYSPTNAADTNVVISGNLGVDDQIPTVASAATITLPVNPTVNLTGTTTVTTINGGWAARQVTIIPLAVASLTTGGNICNAVTTTTNVPVIATYNPASPCWYLK